jgi:pilus assembly protein CpaF
MEGNVITMQEIFAFHQARIDSKGKVRGHFKFQGIRPKFIERFRVAGIDVPQNLFDPSAIFEV